MVDAMIRLFPSDAVDYASNGLGYMPDATEAVVSEERNGAFELTMKYPLTGKRYSELKLRRILVARPNPYAEPQPFRIYEITKPMKKVVTVKAEHISYDMSGYPVSPFSADTAASALSGLKMMSAVTCPFTFWTDKSTSANFSFGVPTAMRTLLGGVDGSILDQYGGEYEFDRFLVKLHGARGMNRGVTIRYGKNLTDLQQEENCAAVYTGVYPYWYSEEDGIVEASPKIINVPGTFNFQRVMTLDLSMEWTEKPTAAQIKERTETYITANDIGVPKVSLDVSFVDLMSSNEYETAALLETVHLCDTVNVEFEELGVKAEAKCIKTEYDILTNRYKSISLGDTRYSIADTIVAQKQADYASEFRKLLDSAINGNNTELMMAIAYATKLITGNLGGNVILHSSTGGETPDEILIMDTTDIRTAKKVWRWNLSGLGYSKTGYNGPYGLAITMDGVIVADFIQAGTMSANRIRGGTLELGGSNNGNGVIIVRDVNGNVIGTWNNKGLSAIGAFVMSMKIGSETFTAELGECPGYASYSKTYGLKLTSSGSNDGGNVYLRPPQYNARGGINPPGLVGNGVIAMRGLVGDHYAEFKAGGFVNAVDGGEVTSLYGLLDGHLAFDSNIYYSTGTCETSIGGQGLCLYEKSVGNTAAGSNDIIWGPRYLSSNTSAQKLVIKSDNNHGNWWKMWYESSSARRYKDVLRDMTESDILKIYNIQPVIAKFKDGILDDDDERCGVYHPMFIADEVEEFFPEATDHLNGQVENWNEKIMIPAMFQMIKSQKEHIDVLEKKVKELKEMIQNNGE